MKFQETDLGFAAMTAKQLESIALEQGGVVGHIAYGTDMRGAVRGGIVGRPWGFPPYRPLARLASPSW